MDGEVSGSETFNTLRYTRIRLCKLESVFVVTSAAVEPTEWVVFGVLVFNDSKDVRS